MHPEKALVLGNLKIVFGELYDAHSETTCSTDSLPAPQLQRS